MPFSLTSLVTFSWLIAHNTFLVHRRQDDPASNAVRPFCNYSHTRSHLRCRAPTGQQDQIPINAI